MLGIKLSLLAAVGVAALASTSFGNASQQSVAEEGGAFERASQESILGGRSRF